MKSSLPTLSHCISAPIQFILGVFLTLVVRNVLEILERVKMFSNTMRIWEIWIFFTDYKQERCHFCEETSF